VFDSTVGAVVAFAFFFCAIAEKNNIVAVASRREYFLIFIELDW
jgi:hypothetical protein